MTALLTAAALFDRALTLLAAVGAVWLIVDLVRHRGEPEPLPGLSRQLGCLAVILTGAAACRLVALSQPITPAYWDAAVAP